MPNIRTIFDNTHVFLGLLNPNGILLEANEPCLRFIGAESDQVLGKPFWETQWWSHHPNSVNKLKEAIKQGARGQLSRFEVEHAEADGNSIHVQFILTPVYEENNGVASLVVEFRDITESVSKEKEQHLNHAVKLSGIGVWEWDMISDQVVWDTKQFELFGIQKMKGSIPLSTVTDAIHPDDREGLNKVAQKVLEGGVSALEEFRVIHPDGSIHWLLGGSSVVHTNGKESSAYLIGINMDITERKETEAALHEIRSQLHTSNKTLEGRIAKRTEQLEEEAEQHRETQSELAVSRGHESIGQLAGGVAHDFNNLLAVIGGNLELAAAHITHDEASTMIADALKAVEAGANLNRRLLTYAQKQKLSPVKLSVADGLSESIHLLRRTLEEDILITTNVDPDLWDVFADPSEIQSAFINLAVNARDAMPRGGSLTIELSNSVLGAEDAELNAGATSREYVGIFVTDTGIGMPPDVKQKALEPFFTTKELGKGSGLGLSSVYGFVRESGGFLKLDSHVGKGTTVRLYLPRAHIQAISHPASVATQQTQHSNEELILVVEDDPMLRKVTVKRLEQLGYQVIEASTAQGAIDKLKPGTPVKLVFTDIVMPGGMSGYELSDWVTLYRKNIRVLLTSGYIDPASHNDNSSASSNILVLSKPYSIGLLAQRVREAIESHV